MKNITVEDTIAVEDIKPLCQPLHINVLLLFCVYKKKIDRNYYLLFKDKIHIDFLFNFVFPSYSPLLFRITRQETINTSAICCK